MRWIDLDHFHWKKHTKHSTDLIIGWMINKCVEKNNVLVASKAIKVSIWVTGSLAAINDIKLLQREVDTTCKFLDTCSQFTFFKRSQLVEQWLNNSGVDSHEEKLEYHPRNKDTRDQSIMQHDNFHLMYLHCNPNIKVKVGTSVLDDP